jgi:HSP20 family protein
VEVNTMSTRDLITWRPSRTETPDPARLPRTPDELPPTAAFLESMDRFVKTFFNDFRLEPPFGSDRKMIDWSPPRVVLAEHSKEFRLTVEMPGLTESDIEVKLAGDRLILGGSKWNAPEDRNHPAQERSYGSFYRSFGLPPGIVRDDVVAEVKDGVLTLRMPKTEEARKVRREVEAGRR